jgi:hypothetical protein
VTKLFFLFVFIVTGGALTARITRRYLRRKKYFEIAAMIFAIVTGALGAIEIFGSADSIVVWLYRKIGPTDEQRIQAAIRSCSTKVEINCLNEGAAFGAEPALEHLKACRKPQILRSDLSTLQWIDVWTTSVYSYAPGAATPGGGKDDDELRVGGWGDWYFTLIRFELPPVAMHQKASFIVLYSKSNEGASVPLMMDRLVNDWHFPKGERLWWKDRPGQRAISTDPLPAPKRDFWYVVELSEIVDEWVGQKSKNYGIQLRPTHDFGSFAVFVSSDASDKTKIPNLIFCI